MVERLPIIGVMGSGTEEHATLAEPLGELIAGLGCHLLTGGRTGTMEAVCRGFCRVTPRKGRTIGILPDGATPNPFVEIPIYTQLSAANDRRDAAWMWSRNHVNVRTATAVVALPGAAGTESEIELAANGAHRRPCIAFLGETGRIGGLQRRAKGLQTNDGAEAPVAVTIEEVAAFLRDALPGTD